AQQRRRRAVGQARQSSRSVTRASLAGPTSLGSDLVQPVSRLKSLTTRAGAPVTTHRSPISPRTTEPAATTTFLPITDPGRPTTPVPCHVPAPILTGLFTVHCLPMGASGSA